MPPQVSSEDIYEPIIADDKLEKLVAPQAGPRKYKLIWVNIIGFTYQHAAAVYGLYLVLYASWATIAFNCVTYYLSALGSCAGAHRLWSHRSYKATMPLQVFLMMCHSLSNQASIFVWARDHRNIQWINQLFCYVFPTLIPVYFWNESFSIAYHINILRFILTVNGAFSINSLAHLYGNRPYDKSIFARQNTITNLMTFGEGYHNYHHTFPYDYKAGEFGNFLNFSASFIDFCAWLGLAYDLKTVSDDVLQRRMMRTGDGTMEGPLDRMKAN